MRLRAAMALQGFLLLLLSATSAAQEVEIGNFRCNNVIFSIGDTRGEVLLQCGPPDFEDRTRIIETRRYDAYLQRYVKEEKEVVDWHYNCGEREFVKIVTFTGGRISSIRNGYRGTGENTRNCW